MKYHEYSMIDNAGRSSSRKFPLRCRTPSVVTSLLAAMAISHGSLCTAYEVSKDTKRNLEAQIQALQSEQGAAADAARASIPVPVYKIKPEKAFKKLSGKRSTTAGISAPGNENSSQTDAITEVSTPQYTLPESAGSHLPQRAAVAGIKQADNISGIDNRYIFEDHSYPFRTVGQVSVEGGTCTGTLVGPRHLLTASHCINWNNDGTTGWLKFEASKYDFYNSGIAWATNVYKYRKVLGPKLTPKDTAFDFVVVILDRRLGDQLGWMSAKEYLPAWNGSPEWANIGYPGDLGGTRPAYQKGCDVTTAIPKTFNGYRSLRLLSLCDVMPGQSGSALYGEWDGVPSVIAVISGGSSSSNSFGGGALLPAIVNQARNERP